jgi:DNA-binding CsgD family transcriptional regulator
LDGKSAVQTANLLFISPRTVESHIESIKNKLNVHWKKELFEKTKILKDVGLI